MMLLRERNLNILLKDLGLVVEKDLSEFRFFEQSLLNFWANLHRPITSW